MGGGPGVGGEANAADGEIDGGEDAAVAADIVGAEIGDGALAVEVFVADLQDAGGAGEGSERKEEEEGKEKDSPRIHERLFCSFPSLCHYGAAVSSPSLSFLRVHLY